jgi:hypothetical protein
MAFHKIKDYAVVAIGYSPLGVAHYAHLDDVSQAVYECTPTALVRKIDCNKIDVFADTLPSRLCGTGWFTCVANPVNSCSDTCTHSCVNN